MTTQKLNSKISQLLKKRAEEVWKQDGLTWDLLIPTLADLQQMAVDMPTEKGVSVLSLNSSYCVFISSTHTEEEDIHTMSWVHSWAKANLPHKEGGNFLIFETQRREDGHAWVRSEPDIVQEADNERMERYFAIVAQHIIRTAGEPTQERLQWLHTLWAEKAPQTPHPLSEVVRSWIQTQLPSVEPERRKDTGILHNALRDSYPSPRLPLEIVSTVPRHEEDMKLFTDLPQGGMQLTMPGFEFPETELVPALPLVAYEGAGGKSLSRGRGAPIDQRLFINVLIEYMHRERGQYDIAQLKSNYRDVKSWLYPNGTTMPKSKLIPSLYKGLWNLHNLRFLWNKQEWNIISVPALPTMAIKLDDPLHFTVRLPSEINNKSGALIGIEPLRLYGAQSAPKFRAWVRLAYLWDKAKQLNGGHRIYATIPEVLRNSDSYLVDAKGQVILTGGVYKTKAGWKCRNGQMPQTAWYHPLAIQTGNQVRNPQADKVPVLSDTDMVKLFFDHKERSGSTFRECLRLARKHAEGMQKDGHIVIEKNQQNPKTDARGWILLEPHKLEHHKTIL